MGVSLRIRLAPDSAAPIQHQHPKCLHIKMKLQIKKSDLQQGHKVETLQRFGSFSSLSTA